MGKHFDIGRARHFRQPRDRCRHVIGARDDAVDQFVERCAGQPGALDHAVALLRLGEVRHRRVHVVIERKQVDAAFRQPLPDLAFGVEIVGLMAEMDARIRSKPRPQALDRVEQPPRIRAAAQARLPRPGGGVKHRGDAVGNRLAVAVDQRHVDGKIDTGSRHHLPLESVAMQVDDARQHQQATRIDGEWGAGLIAADTGDLAARGLQRSVAKFFAEQGPATFDQNVGHDVALRRLL